MGHTPPGKAFGFIGMRMVSQKKRLVRRPYLIAIMIVILFAAVLALGFSVVDYRFPPEITGSREAVLAAVDAAIGATVEPLDRTTAEGLGIPPKTKGLVVTSLGRNGPAERAGIKAGDVIVRIDGAPVSSVGAAAAALEEAPGANALIINRRGHYANVQLPMRAPDRSGPVDKGAMR